MKRKFKDEAKVMVNQTGEAGRILGYMGSIGKYLVETKTGIKVRRARQLTKNEGYVDARTILILFSMALIGLGWIGWEAFHTMRALGY